jgi:alkylation response protein AidB-like acyl-CoA dehydrogenase
MRFRAGEDAVTLRDAAEALLTARATPAVIRASWQSSDQEGAPAGDVPGAANQAREIWLGLADIGLAGALVPETDGGLGLDPASLPPVLERLGYCGLPLPAVETIAVAAPLLARAGHPALADVLSGAALVTAQLAPDAEPGEPTGPDRPVLVPFGQIAEYALLTAADGLRLYERGELDTEPVAAIDGARQLTWVRPTPGGGALLAGSQSSEQSSAWQLGVLGTAAVLVGLADRMLSMTVDYVKGRHQFGVPVGSFQAVKHRLADAFVGIEFARPAVLAAAWAQAAEPSAQDASAADPDAADQTSIAKVLASDAAVAAARAALQCHGAIGYTTEYDLHLYAKRAWALAPSWGSADWHRRRLAQVLGLEKKG